MGSATINSGMIFTLTLSKLGRGERFILLPIRLQIAPGKNGWSPNQDRIFLWWLTTISFTSTGAKI